MEASIQAECEEGAKILKEVFIEIRELSAQAEALISKISDTVKVAVARCIKIYKDGQNSLKDYLIKNCIGTPELVPQTVDVWTRRRLSSPNKQAPYSAVIVSADSTDY